MKTLKSVLAAAIFMAIFSIQSIANPITPTTYDIVTSLTAVRAEVNKVMQNTSFSKLGIEEAEVMLKFKINQRGQLVILEMNSESTKLLDLVQERLQDYRIGNTPVPVDMVYHVKVKFEVH